MLESQVVEEVVATTEEGKVVGQGETEDDETTAMIKMILMETILLEDPLLEVEDEVAEQLKQEREVEVEGELLQLREAREEEVERQRNENETTMMRVSTLYPSYPHNLSHSTLARLDGYGGAGGSTEPPNCKCSEPAVSRTVNKDGPNKGRTFWACSKGMNESCGFFEWNEDEGGGGGRAPAPRAQPSKRSAPSTSNVSLPFLPSLVVSLA